MKKKKKVSNFELLFVYLVMVVSGMIEDIKSKFKKNDKRSSL